jgi:WD40 repeat protein
VNAPRPSAAGRGRAGVILCVLLLVAGSGLLVTSRVAALEKRTAVAEAFRLRAAAGIAGNPRLALQYALAAHQLDPGGGTADDLRRLLDATPYDSTLPVEDGGPVEVASAGAEGAEAVVTAGRSRLAVWPVRATGDSTKRDAASSGGRLAVSATGIAFVSGDTGSSLWDVGLEPSTRGPRHLADWPQDDFATLRATGGRQAAAFSPDGQLLAVGGQQILTHSPPRSAVTIWSMATPDNPRPEIFPLYFAPSPVTAVAFSADGGLVAAGGADGTTAVWSLTSLVAYPVYIDPAGPPGRDPAVTALAFSPHSRTLAIGHRGGTVALWDATDPAAPTLVQQPLVVGTSVLSLAFHPVLRELAVGGSEITVLNFVDVSDTRWTVRGEGDPISSIVFSPDGSLVTSGADGTAARWRLGGALAGGHSGVDVRGRACAVTAGGLTPDQWRRTAADLAFEDSCADP